MKRVVLRRGRLGEFGLYRSGRQSAAFWVWWNRGMGIEVRWDPDIMGTKALLSIGSWECGWRR